MQSLKALYSIDIRLEGKLTLTRLLHPSNAPIGIVFTFVGIVITPSETQFLNAFFQLFRYYLANLLFQY